ncbi:MAG: glycosyltransferase [Candidatus Omnitrophota bacterium]
MKKPLVSIIVVNYNGKRFLKDCFDSLMNLNYPKSKLEIIMVDNGSNDGSIEFVKENYPKIRILKNDVNNYCRANNLGIKHAKGEYIAFLNNDTKVDKEWLNELIKVITSDENIGGVGGKTLYPDGKISNVGHYELPNFYWGEKGAGQEKTGYQKVEERPSLCGVAVLYPKRIFEKVGLLDEDFIIYMEDIDISYRIRKAGYKLLYVPQAIVHHYFHGTGNHDLSRFYIERNRLLFLAKHYPHMLMSSLLGNGYFTAQKDLNSTGKIYSIISDVIIKLFKEHPGEYIKEILNQIIEELRKISNYENDLLIKKINEQTYFLEKNDERIKELENKLGLLNQKNIEKDKELEEKKLEIEQKLGEIRKRDEWLTNLKEEIVKREEKIKEQENKIKEQEELLAKLKEELNLKSHLLIEKEKEIENYTEKISQNIKEIENLRKALEEKDLEINFIKEKNLKLSNSLSELNKSYEEKSKELSRISTELKKIYESEGYRFILWPLWQIIAFLRNIIKGIFRLISVIFLSPIFIFIPFLFFFEEKFWQLLSSFLKRKIPKRDVVPFEKLKISVVIPHYNQIEFLKECLSSLFSLDEFKNQENEVLVVDDASNNESIKFIETNFPRVRIIRNRINRGFGYSADRGIREAKNDLILLLNNDCIVTKDFLVPLIRHFQDEKVFAVTPKFYTWDRKSFLCGMWMGEFKNGYIHFWNEKDTKNGEKIYETSPTSFAIGACILFRKKDYLWLGGFDSSYRPYCWEDIDFCYRAWKRGLKVLYEPESIVYHKRKASIGEYKRSLETKNEIVFIWKNITDSSMLVSHLIRLPFKIYRNGLSFLLGFIWAISLLPSVLLKRLNECRFEKIRDKHILRDITLYYKNFEKRKFYIQNQKRKTILMLTPFPPYKPKHGAQLVIWNRLQAIYKEYDIILLTFLENGKQFTYLPELKLYCKEVFAFLRTPDKVSLIQRLLYPEPLRKRYSKIEFRNKLREIIEKYSIDLTLIETSFMIQYVNYIKDIPVILEEHDASILSISKSFERRVNHGLIRNLFNWVKNRIYLVKLYKKFDKIIVFTEPDAKLIKKVNPYLDISIIPVGLDLELFKSDKKYEKDIDILFVGHFAHYPNVDGMKYFFKKIYPFLKKRLPSFVFKIIGSGIKKEEFMSIFKIDPEDKNIEFIGEIEEHEKVIEYLFRTKVFITPIRMGGGVKIKVLEAMAAGVSMVATHNSINGLCLQYNENIIIANRAPYFAEGIIRLLKDNELSQEIPSQTTKMTIKNYDNSLVGHAINSLFENLLYVINNGSNNDMYQYIHINATKGREEKSTTIPICCSWDLIMRCNYRCPYCFNDGHWEDLEKLNFLYSTEEWLNFWRRVYNKYGEIHITISGGEPFIYPDFVKLLSNITKMHTLGIVTNLSWNIKNFIKIMSPERIKIYPSFHPYSTDINNFMDKMRKLDNLGWKYLGVVIVAYPPILKELEFYINLFRQNGFYPWINPYIGYYNNRKYPESYSEEERRYLFKVSDNRDFVEYQLKGYSGKGRLCHTGEFYFRVHPDGWLFRCANSVPIGHIKNHNFSLSSTPVICQSEFCMCSNEYIYLVGQEDKLLNYINSSKPRLSV